MQGCSCKACMQEGQHQAGIYGTKLVVFHNNAPYTLTAPFWHRAWLVLYQEASLCAPACECPTWYCWAEQLLAVLACTLYKTLQGYQPSVQ
jgi:hypothetical protein